MKTKSSDKIRELHIYDLEWNTEGPYLTIAFPDRYNLCKVLVALSDEYDFLSSHAAFTYTRMGEENLVELIFKEKEAK